MNNRRKLLIALGAGALKRLGGCAPNKHRPGRAFTLLVVVWAALTMTIAIAVVCASPAIAAEYPTKPIRLIVPVAAGGNVDTVARGVAQRLSDNIGQQVIVENRPGASSLVGTQFVAKSAPDGYTLLAMANTFTVVPAIVANPGYDPVKDFAGVSQTCRVPQLLVVTPALPVRSVKELIALARKRPGEVSFASAGSGAMGHMAAERFSHQAGVKMLHVPYKGNSQAIVDVMGGQVMLMFDPISTSGPYVQAGRLRALAVSSLKRSPIFPEVPTIDEAGLQGYEAITFNGLVAPAATPRDLLTRLHAEVAKAVGNAELRERFLQRGIEMTASATPDGFTAFIRSEVASSAKLAREAGIKAD